MPVYIYIIFCASEDGPTYVTLPQKSPAFWLQKLFLLK